jgi:hypothetical protein
LIALATILAITAWTVGWYRSETLRPPELVAGAAGALAAILLFRQIRQRQAASLALQSVTARVGDTLNPQWTRSSRQTKASGLAIQCCGRGSSPLAAHASPGGQPMSQLLPPRLRDKHRGHIERFGRQGDDRRRMGGQTPVLTALRGNGENFRLRRRSPTSPAPTSALQPHNLLTFQAALDRPRIPGPSGRSARFPIEESAAWARGESREGAGAEPHRPRAS